MRPILINGIHKFEVLDKHHTANYDVYECSVCKLRGQRYGQAGVIHVEDEAQTHECHPPQPKGVRMAKRGKQLSAFENDPLDPEIAKVADAYVEIIEEQATIKERREIQERNLSGMMKNAKLTKFAHKGHVIELVHDETDKIHLKKVKELRKARQRGKKEEAAE